MLLGYCLTTLRLARLCGGTRPTEVHVNRRLSDMSSLPTRHFPSCPAQQALRRPHTPSWLPGIYRPQEGEEEEEEKKKRQLSWRGGNLLRKGWHCGAE